VFLIPRCYCSVSNTKNYLLTTVLAYYRCRTRSESTTTKLDKLKSFLVAYHTVTVCTICLRLHSKIQTQQKEIIAHEFYDSAYTSDAVTPTINQKCQLTFAKLVSYKKIRKYTTGQKQVEEVSEMLNWQLKYKKWRRRRRRRRRRCRPYYAQILAVRSLLADTRYSPEFSNATHWTASSWPVNADACCRTTKPANVVKIIRP